MARRLLTKLATELDAQEVRNCYNMSFRSAGDLSEWLYQARHWSEWKDTKVILVKEDDFFLGWGLRRSDGEVGFWTRREARGKGVGLAMVKRAATMGYIITHPHDDASRALFKKASTILKGEFALVDHNLDYLNSVAIQLEELGRDAIIELEAAQYGDHLLKVPAK